MQESSWGLCPEVDWKGLRRKRRKILYFASSIQFPFSFFFDSYICHIPQCLIRGKKLSNSTIAPAKLKQHFNTERPKLKTILKLLIMQQKEIRFFEHSSVWMKKLIKNDQQNKTTTKFLVATKWYKNEIL